MGIHTVGEPLIRPTALPGAASRAVQRTLEGPGGEARLLAAFPSAVHLAAADGAVLALVTSDAVRLPNAVVPATDRTGSPLTRLVQECDAAGCGAGVLRIGTLRVHVARWWTPRRPHPPLDRAALRAGTAELEAAFRRTEDPRPGLPGSGRAALARLTRSTAGGDRTAAAAAAARLVGLAPGPRTRRTRCRCSTSAARRPASTSPRSYAPECCRRSTRASPGASRARARSGPGW
ncbi:hypothetical protein ACWGI8_33845 [Streptomyces sp. NPDC054841]